jgi:triacylglycerol lipase
MRLLLAQSACMPQVNSLAKKKTPSRRRPPIPPPEDRIYEHEGKADIPIWKEALFGAELLLLHASPVFYGLGIPHGDHSGVIVIPGFLGTDLYLSHLHSWLGRIGYRSYLSGIGLNAECPNLLIQYRLAATLRKAIAETGRKVHLIGHSLGGIIARSLATQHAGSVASVITLASPIRGTVMHPSIVHAANSVRSQILDQHGHGVLPDCYTPRCTCNFLSSLRCAVPASVHETAIYTRDDGVVDWHYCRTGDPDIDFEVPGTHVGLVFNPSVYAIVAERLAYASSEE